MDLITKNNLFKECPIGCNVFCYLGYRIPKGLMKYYENERPEEIKRRFPRCGWWNVPANRCGIMGEPFDYD